MKPTRSNSYAVSRCAASICGAALLLLLHGSAQTTKTQSDSVALPERIAPSTPNPTRMLPLAPNVPPSVSPLLDAPIPFPDKDTPPPVVVVPPAAAAVAPPQPVASPRDPAPLPIGKKAPAAKGDIMLNFQGAALSDVLNYLSEAAGFVIVQEAPVSGTVNVVSRQPLNMEEAVDLLNSVLVEKGYVALRNGRILKIINRRDAQKRELPVRTGSDPEQIPRKDEMVTQILPVRHGEAAKLVDNLRPLLPDNANITANEGSNSILMTDTLMNIHRIAEIIRAIDTSVEGIVDIRVFSIQYANAKDLATVITQLFAAPPSTDQNRRRGGFPGFGGGGGFPGFGGGGDRGGGGGQQMAATSEARQAASRVVAVADDQSNSLIVSATAEVLDRVGEIIAKIDQSTTDITDTRMFRLQHADATEMADTINALYADTTSQSGQNRNRGQRGSGFGGQGFGQQGGGGQQQSQRALIQSKVIAVGEPRTNSLLVTAATQTMAEIAEMVGRLDATDAKRQRVYVYSLQHADPDSVATVLRGMLGDESATNSAQQTGAARLTERSAQGAQMDTSAFQNSGRGGGGGGGGR